MKDCEKKNCYFDERMFLEELEDKDLLHSKFQIICNGLLFLIIVFDDLKPIISEFTQSSLIAVPRSHCVSLHFL